MIPSLDSLIGKTPIEVDQIKLSQLQFYGGKSDCESEGDNCVIAAVRIKLNNGQES